MGVIEDVRMRGPFLYQTQVTAIFTADPIDERLARYLVRTSTGRAAEVRDAAAAALSRAVAPSWPSSSAPVSPSDTPLPAAAAVNLDYIVKASLFDISHRLPDRLASPAER